MVGITCSPTVAYDLLNLLTSLLLQNDSKEVQLTDLTLWFNPKDEFNVLDPGIISDFAILCCAKLKRFTLANLSALQP